MGSQVPTVSSTPKAFIQNALSILWSCLKGATMNYLPNGGFNLTWLWLVGPCRSNRQLLNTRSWMAGHETGRHIALMDQRNRNTHAIANRGPNKPTKVPPNLKSFISSRPVLYATALGGEETGRNIAVEAANATTRPISI